jgi:hypothetical protein
MSSEMASVAELSLTDRPSRVRAHLLRAGCPTWSLGPDSADRRHGPRCYVVGELFRGPGMKRSASSSGADYASDTSTTACGAWVPRMIIMSSS